MDKKDFNDEHPQLPAGKIFLIPSALGENGPEYFPPITKQKIFEVEFFLVENERSARRFLRSIGYKNDFNAIEMTQLKGENDFSFATMLKPYLLSGKNAGVLSEAGCPGIADPGNTVVKWAHENNFDVTPLIGPSSIFLALMSSGLNGQQFTFHGYLPVSPVERRKKLKTLEDESQCKNQTQIFIETPYRNDSMLVDILHTLKPQTRLCIASNVTLHNEFILTKPVNEWKKKKPDLKKQPAVFLIQS